MNKLARLAGALALCAAAVFAGDCMSGTDCANCCPLGVLDGLPQSLDLAPQSFGDNESGGIVGAAVDTQTRGETL
jgi:hypothetical protein